MALGATAVLAPLAGDFDEEAYLRFRPLVNAEQEVLDGAHSNR